MWDDEERSIYYLNKMFLAVIYRNHNDDFYKQTEVLYDIDVFDAFKDAVNELGKRKYLGNEAKRSIYDIVEYARSKEDNDRAKRLDICNDIISIVNLSEDESLSFYIPQIINRIETKRDFKKRSCEEVYSMIPIVHESLQDDFLLLYSHGDDVDLDTFLQYYLPQFIDTPFYLVSLDMILKECPKIFENKEFLIRVSQVLHYSKFEDKKLKKVINNKLKKVLK